MKFILKTISLTLLIIILYIFISYLNIWKTIIEKQEFIIKKWDTLYSLQKKLNFNVNLNLYKLWIKLNHSNFNLQEWSYRINDNIELNTIFKEVLNKPLFQDFQITILPWWNIFDIDAYLSNKEIIKKGDFIKYAQNINPDLKNKYLFLQDIITLEWFIYPDTYRIAKNANINDIINILLNEFNKKIYTKYKFSSNKDFYEKLILASILEKEEKMTKNKSIIAGILIKRLNQKIAIWADATVCYEYKLTSKECTPEFIWSKIYIKSKYNTRHSLWLPPTPISNMTQETFDSIINYENSLYYYYLHDNNWVIYFSKTLNEHNKKRFEFLNN